MLFALPRSVNIVNTRLKLLHWILFFVAFATATLHFIVGKQYLSPRSLQPSFYGEMWANTPRFDDVKQDVDDLRNNSDLCLSPEKYDFWWDADGMWRYDDFTCLPLCPEGKHNKACVHMSDFYDQYGKENVVLVTAVRETFFTSTNSLTSVPVSRNYWTMSAQSLTVGFTYSYEVKQKDPLSVALDQLRNAFGVRLENKILQASSVGSQDTKPLHTIILDAEGQFWRAVSPGPSIDLTVPELLELAGERALLDNPNRYATANQLQREGVISGNPVAHITGVSLQLEVGCYNNLNPALVGIELPTEVSDLDSMNICTLKVRRLPVAWVTRSRKDTLESGLLVRWSSGIDISISYAGEYRYVDLGQLFITLMAFMVALAIPGKLISFIAIYCLGQLSRAYKTVLIHDFDISEQVAGAAARLSACSLSYEAFGDQVKRTGLSLALFRERLQLILGGSPHLDEEEIANMAKFCFGRAVRRPGKILSVRKRFALRMGLQSVASELGVATVITREHDDRELMGLDDFCSAYCSAEPLAFSEMSIYFDRDRKIPFLERLFTPIRFWIAVHNASKGDEAAGDSCVPSAGGAVDSGSRTESCNLVGSAASDRLSSEGSSSEDAQATATSLSNVLDRLSAAELRLVESERSVIEWRQRSLDLESAMREMERSVQELKGRGESPVDTQVDRALGKSIRPTALSELEQLEQRLQEHVVSSRAASLETSTILDALSGRVEMLERRMAIAAADIFDMSYDRRSSGLRSRWSHESRSLPSTQRGGGRPRRTNDDDHTSDGEGSSYAASAIHSRDHA